MPLFGAVTGLAALGFAGYQYAKSRADKRKGDADFRQTLRNRARYATPQSVTDVAADARARLNAQNPATIAAQQQLQQQAAAEAGFAQRNATSGAQAIQAAADANAQMYSAVPQLAAQDAAFRQNAVQSYYQTQQGLTEDARYRHADEMERNDTQANYALGRVGAAQAEGSQALATGVQGLGMIAGSLGNYNMRGRGIAPRTAATAPSLRPGYGIGNSMLPYSRSQWYQPYSFASY